MTPDHTLIADLQLQASRCRGQPREVMLRALKEIERMAGALALVANCPEPTGIGSAQVCRVTLQSCKAIAQAALANPVQPSEGGG